MECFNRITSKRFQFFMMLILQTGLPKDIVTTVTYPNAVLNYCVYLPPAQCNGTSFEKFRTGDRVMVISFEGKIYKYFMLTLLNADFKIETKGQRIHKK